MDEKLIKNGVLSLAVIIGIFAAFKVLSLVLSLVLWVVVGAGAFYFYKKTKGGGL